MKTIGFVIVLFLTASFLKAQVPSITFTGPGQTLVNQQACMDVEFSNTDTTGFQPYLRVILPPELSALNNSALFGEEFSGVNYHGLVTAEPKADPNVPSSYPDLRYFTAPEGSKYFNVNLPVGTVLADELTLSVGFCATLNASAVINEPIEVCATPVFRYGNDPTGDSAPTIGETVCITIVPIAYTASAGASPSSSAAGSCWQAEHTVTVDVAMDLWLNDLLIDVQMPDSLVYNGVIDMTPGCSLTSEPALGETGGVVGVECSNLVGVEENDDVFITYSTYVDDVLDPNACDGVEQVSQVVVSSGVMPDLALDASVNAEHFKLQLGDSELSLFPGSPTLLIFEYAASAYIDGITQLEQTFTLPDGITYLGGAAMDGTAITGETVTYVGNTTQIHLELTDSAGDIPACGTGTIMININLEETLSDGSPVLAGDSFPISSSGTYDIIGGISGCVAGQAATISVAGVEGSFDVSDVPINGEAYVPGEWIDYQITLEIPSNDVGNVLFEVLFPVPIHDVGDLDLIFGNHITASGLDTEGITPVITTDTLRNALYLDYGNVSLPTAGSSSVISAVVSIPVTDVPFPLGLSHSAIARLHHSNSSGADEYLQFVRGVMVGSSELKAWHGAYQSDNPQATFQDLSLPYDGEIYGIDGSDEVRFRITVKNQGSADAYNVIVFDSTATTQFNTCNLIDVTHPGDIPCTYSGDLFTSGLLIDFIERDNAINTLDVAYVDYRCWVKPAQYVKAGDDFEKEAIIDWAASPDATERYDPIYAQATGNLGVPQVNKEVTATYAGYTGSQNATIGELVEYTYTLTMPEAVSPICSLIDTLSYGLSFEALDSLGVMPGIFTSATPVANLANAVNFTNLGALGDGPVTERRQMSVNFGNISNNNDDNEVIDQMQFVYTARVLNVAEAMNNDVLHSTTHFTYENGDGNEMLTNTVSAQTTVREPLLTTETALNDTQLYPGESSFITVTIDHLPESSYPAFDLDLVLDLPLGLNYVDGSFLSECPQLIAEGPTYSFGQLTWKLTSLPMGSACQFIIGVEVDASFPACSEVEACMYTEWTSTSEADAAMLGTPINSLGYERTGSTTNPGGALNTYGNSFCQTVEIVNDALVTPVISGDDIACTGQTITLSIPAYSGIGLVYHWQGPEGELGINSNTITFNNASTDLSGAYTAWVDIGDCSSAEAVPFEVTVSDPPTVTMADVVATCLPEGSSLELSTGTLSGIAPYIFHWNGEGFESTDSVAVITNANELDNGVYTVWVEDATGCISEIESFNVDITQAPGTPGVTGNASLCSGDDLLLQTSNYGPGSVYHWDTPDGEISSTSPTLTMTDMQPGEGGSFTVWVHAGQCDTPVSDAVNVTISPQPDAPQISMSEEVACAGDNISFFTETEADSYLWEGPNEYASGSQNPPQISSLSTANQGTYTLTVWVNGCASDPSSIYLNVVPQPEAPEMTAESPICEGTTLLLESGELAQEYQWTLANGDQVTSFSDTYSIDNAAPAETGQYSLSVFDGTCWSAASDPIEIVVEAIPNVQAVAGPDQVICEGEDALIESQNADGVEGTWTSPNPDVLIAEPNAKITVISGLEAGSSNWITWSLYTEGCGVFSTDSLLVSAPNSPQANTDVGQLKQTDVLQIDVLDNDQWANLGYTVSIASPPPAGTAEVQDDGSLLYVAGDSYLGTLSFTYELCLDACPNLCDTAEVRLEILPQLVVYDVITPNGDQANDTFVIEGLDRFPNHELVIVNRWGTEVYKAAPYANDWNGTWNGQPLPEGTYFYNLKDTTGLLSQGFLIVKR